MKRSLRNKTVLVGGGCGFMGSNFIHYLLAQNSTVRVINLDLLTYAGNPENLRGVPRARYRFVRGDITNTRLMKRLMRGADFVVNFAAETHVDRSIHGNDDAFMCTNVLGVHSLLRALMASPQVKLMIHISTDEVWGDLPLSSRKKFTEESPLRPSSPYAASKAAGDLVIRSFVRTYKLPIVTTHSTNNFGPRQFPEKLIPFFVTRALKNLPLPLYGDGLNRRDWLFVDDHSRAVLALLERGVAGEEYAISCEGKEYSNKTIAGFILAAMQKQKNFIGMVADRPGHDRRYAVSSAKLRKLGWKPRHSVEEALRTTVNWYLHNAAWLRSSTKRAGKLNPHITV